MSISLDVPASVRTEVSAAVLCDSVTPDGDRLTTIEVTFHRFVLAEFNTHRVFSRNSASSRAIPVKKQLAKVQEYPAIPVVWPTEQKGMQGGEPLEPELALEAVACWLSARDSMVQHVWRLVELGVHKCVANRLLEPFMWHTVIVTSSCWSNYWRQRVSPLAQPEIKVASEAMFQAYVHSSPTAVPVGRWHLPLVTQIERETWEDLTLKKVSAARCARTSYLTHDGLRDIAADEDMFTGLTTADPMHASPLEHVATPCTCEFFEDHQGNFIGWDQFRHEIEATRGIHSYT